MKKLVFAALVPFLFLTSVFADEPLCQNIINTELSKFGMGSFYHPSSQVSKFHESLYSYGANLAGKGDVFTFQAQDLGKIVSITEFGLLPPPNELSVAVEIKVDEKDKRANRWKTTSFHFNKECKPVNIERHQTNEAPTTISSADPDNNRTAGSMQ